MITAFETIMTVRISDNSFLFRKDSLCSIEIEIFFFMNTTETESIHLERFQIMMVMRISLTYRHKNVQCLIPPVDFIDSAVLI